MPRAVQFFSFAANPLAQRRVRLEHAVTGSELVFPVRPGLTGSRVCVGVMDLIVGPVPTAPGTECWRYDLRRRHSDQGLDVPRISPPRRIPPGPTRAAKCMGVQPRRAVYSDLQAVRQRASNSVFLAALPASTPRCLTIEDRPYRARTRGYYGITTQGAGR